jgi:N-acetylglucosaminyl-diphospho-decaprenol L-rhamnosyltransferase
VPPAPADIPGAAPSSRPRTARGATRRAAAVVVDHDAGVVLADCVRSLLDDGADPVVVVENGERDGAVSALRAAGLDVAVVAPGRNVGYGAGANRGIAAVPDAELVLVCNADLRVHAGALAALADALAGHPAWAVVGPRILTPEGQPYPSVRSFPSARDAAGHALLGIVRPTNRFTRRYRPAPPDTGAPVTAGWVSGACLLLRRDAMEELGGFDESYFMFAEEMDLCWRAHQAGWDVGYQPAAAVTHLQGHSTRAHPYRMIGAHHRSALRFTARTTTGWRRLALPAAALVLSVRFAVAVVAETLRPGHGR